jgi:hypothetical protein
VDPAEQAEAERHAQYELERSEHGQPQADEERPHHVDGARAISGQEERRTPEGGEERVPAEQNRERAQGWIFLM